MSSIEADRAVNVRLAESWRELLIELSRHLTTKNCRDLLDYAMIPDGIAEEIKAARDTLTCLEKCQKISKENVDSLIGYLQDIKRRDLIGQVEKFKRESLELQRKSANVDHGKVVANKLKIAKSVPSHQPLLGPKSFSRSKTSSQAVANDEQTPTPVSEVAEEGNYSAEESLPCTLPERNVNSSEHEVKTLNPVQRTSSSEIATSQEQDIPPEMLYKIKKGYCLIINNEKFGNKVIDNKILGDRTGSSVDRAKLKNTFEWLGFEVRIIDDAKDQEIRNAFTEVNYADYDSFVCFILSHGFSKGIYTSDGQYIFYDELRRQFCGSINECLLGKPKLFFIQACRGDNFDFGSVSSDAPATQSPQEVSRFIPNDADFLFAYSATPGNVSWRSESTGTWFISTLCQVLRDYSHKLDLNRMLVIANSKLSEKNGYPDDVLVKQSGDHHSSLRRIIYFSPGISWRKSEFFEK